MGQNFQQSQKTYQPGTNLAAPHLLHEETLLQQFTDRAYELREVKDSLRLQDVAHLAADLEENADFRALPHEALRFL